MNYFTVSPDFCGSSVWNLLHVILLGSRIFKLFLDFFWGGGGVDIFIPTAVSFVVTNVAADMNFNSSVLQRRSAIFHPFNKMTYVIYYSSPSSGIRHFTDTSPHNTTFHGYITTQYSYITYNESFYDQKVGAWCSFLIIE